MSQYFILQKKEEYLKKLTLQYEAAYQQLFKDINEANKVSIKEQIKDLENEMQEVSHEIDQLRFNINKAIELAIIAKQKKEVAFQIDQDNQAPTAIQHKQKMAEIAEEESLEFSSALHREYNQIWEDNLHKINFYRVNQIIHTILGQWKTKSGYSLFILTKSTFMGGKWCLQIMKSFIKEIGGSHHFCQFKFTPSQIQNNLDFLNYLANKFGITPNQSKNSQEYTRNIIEGICNSLFSGNILFIDVEIYSLDAEDSFLVWFVDQLWNPLISRLEQTSQQHRLIRVVSVIAVHGQVPEVCLPPNLCCGCGLEDFDSRKVLEIPLETWTEEEIKNWLFSFSGLTAPKIGVSAPEIDAMARAIFAASDGVPGIVYPELKQQLTHVLQSKFEQYKPYESNNSVYISG
ncbi:MAG: hypothetical protein F6J96_24430 [Symploca sp. SIO1C2]|nr:hypothetical protein [Symploca sp. SIO1C2]